MVHCAHFCALGTTGCSWQSKSCHNRITIAVAALVLTCGVPRTAFALPLFAEAYGYACTKCQVQVPALKSYGRCRAALRCTRPSCNECAATCRSGFVALRRGVGGQHHQILSLGASRRPKVKSSTKPGHVQGAIRRMPSQRCRRAASSRGDREERDAP
jgi:hypothetical protein